MGEVDDSHGAYYPYTYEQLTDQYATSCPKEVYISSHHWITLLKRVILDTRNSE